MAFNSETRANTKTHYSGFITPLSYPMDFQCQPKSPIANPFPVLENPVKPMDLFPADMVESQLQPHQQPNRVLVENMGLLEPTPIGHECHTRAPSIDIKLLRDILDNALLVEQQGEGDLDSDTNDFGHHSAKRKKPSSLAACLSPLTKKRRTGDEAPIIRPYQETKWSEQYQELVKFKEEAGHCNVPIAYKPHTGLSNWIKRQRYQYKLRSQGKPSTMTEDRIQQLERLGFVWEYHAAAWDQRFAELKEFHSCYGHCDVPSSFSSNPHLATWVKVQRRQYRLFFKNNVSSSTTPERIAKLEGIGFKWRVRREEILTKMNGLSRLLSS